MSAVEQLKVEAAKFYGETKKRFRSCRSATLLVDDDGFHGAVGRFSNRNQALDVMKMWAMAFCRSGNMKPSITVDGNAYLVVIG